MSSYPVGLRSVLKGAPSVLMLFTTSTIFYLFQYAILHHNHDRIPKPSFKYTFKYLDQQHSSYISDRKMILTDKTLYKCLIITPMLNYDRISTTY